MHFLDVNSATVHRVIIGLCIVKCLWILSDLDCDLSHSSYICIGSYRTTDVRNPGHRSLLSILTRKFFKQYQINYLLNWMLIFEMVACFHFRIACYGQSKGILLAVTVDRGWMDALKICTEYTRWF